MLELTKNECRRVLNDLIHDINLYGDVAIDGENAQKIYDHILPQVLNDLCVDEPFGLEDGDIHEWIDSMQVNCDESVKTILSEFIIE